MVSGSRACLTFILSDHPHRPSRHFDGALTFSQVALDRSCGREASDCPEPDARLLTAQVELAHVDELARRGQEGLASRIRNEDWLPRSLRHSLDARRRVHGIPINRILEPTGRAHVSGNEQSAVEADAHLEAVAEGPLAHTAF